MTPAEAAQIVGCTAGTIRSMIRQGKVRAKRVDLPGGGYAYNLTQKEAERLRDTPADDPRGWKRGRKRKTRS